jgi:lysophospholipase L1-like esterase
MKTIPFRRLAFLACVASLLVWAIACQILAADKAGPERWQKAIAAFQAADKTSPPPQNAILFIGSSTMVLWKTLAHDFPEHVVINRGFGGSQIVDSVFYADRIVIPYRPRMIVLRAGGNDIHAGKTPEQVAADFQAFVEKVRAKLPDVRIAYMPINATPLRWANAEREKQANQLIKARIAAGQNLDYIDTYDATLGADGKPREELFLKDRLHFNAEGYKILTAIVRKHLPAPSGAAVRIEKDVEFLGPDRQEKGDLYLPAKVAEGQRCPAVVIIHGGGWSGGDKGAAREINIGTNLALNGYVGFSINYVLAKGKPTWPQNLYGTSPEPRIADSAGLFSWCASSPRDLLHQAEAQGFEQPVQGGRGQFCVTGAEVGQEPRLDPNLVGQFVRGSLG